MSLLEVSNISAHQEEGTFALKNISFTQEKFQKIAIAGETGAGKSTLMKVIAGLLPFDSGELLLDGRKLQGPGVQLIPGHAGVGYLSQYFELRNHYRMEELLSYANKLPDQQAQHIYDLCRISHLLKRKNDALSGGEKQRIAMARLLVSAPTLLLLDEPFSNLDLIHKNILKSVIEDIGNQLGITCILTSHDPLDTLSWADEIIVMKEGAVVQQDTPEVIYHKPADGYVAAMFGSFNLLSPEQARVSEAESAGKQLFIRPEQVSISRGTSHNATGRVTDISFYGSYYELKVTFPDNSVLLRTLECRVKKGDWVNLACAPDYLWYI